MTGDIFVAGKTVTLFAILDCSAVEERECCIQEAPKEDLDHCITIIKQIMACSGSNSVHLISQWELRFL